MKFFKKNTRPPENADHHLLLDYPDASPYAEAYRTLRANLAFAAPSQNRIEAVIVTSAVEGEGKTSTVVNLACTLARAGKKVLMIDADLRRPGLSQLFSAQGEKGFSGLVTEDLNTWKNEGDLEHCTFQDLFQLIELQKRSGDLTISDDQQKIVVSFMAGRPVDLFWQNRSGPANILNSLIKKGALSKEDALPAWSGNEQSARSLAAVLDTMGLVSREILIRELSVHTLEAIRRLYRMNGGSFSFTSARDGRQSSTFGTGLIDVAGLISEYQEGQNNHVYIRQCLASAITETGVDNLDLLPAGRRPSNPSEIIASDGAGLLVRTLRSMYDFIILDSSPVVPAADAMVMATRTDGIILVIKSGHLDRKMVKAVTDQIKKAGAPVLGTVLNQVDMKKDAYYREYNRYYTSYYG